MRTHSGFFLLVVLLAGCARGGKDSDFTPPADNARKVLEVALAHWQAGNPPGTIPGTSPAVEVMDARWKAGQKLKAYEVLREEAGEGAARAFAVRLTPDKGPPVEVRYMVVGIDPIWVSRDEDFQKLSGAGK